MLKGHGSDVQDEKITGITVNKKADALFFLHTFNRGNGIAGWERRYQDAQRRNRPLPEVPLVFQYVLHYADGQSATVPVRWQEGVGHWVDTSPKALPQAAIAWTHRFENSQSDEKAVVYSMQWDNPRPDVPIRSIDLGYGPDGSQWGAPAVFAITAAISSQ